MSEMSMDARLPRSFHKTFKPERQYIGAMLKYAGSGRQGDPQEIASATGIPTGTSTGKVPAILDYGRAMGLIQLTGAERSAVKKPELTSFGRIVLLEDPFLKTPITQWIAHLNLCGPIKGADVWYQTFFSGLPSLGMNFERTQLELYLSSVASFQATIDGCSTRRSGTPPSVMNRCGAKVVSLTIWVTIRSFNRRAFNWRRKSMAYS